MRRRRRYLNQCLRSVHQAAGTVWIVTDPVEPLDIVSGAFEAQHMNTVSLLSDAFDRVLESATDTVAKLTPGQLTQRPDERANSIAWLVWHLTRVQDDHVCDLAGVEQTWSADGWSARFALDLDEADTGYGHTREEVAKVTADSSMLTNYLAAVTARTKEYLTSLHDDDYDRVIDSFWDPPVTVGVRLISVVNDDTQHAGQAAYVRGLLFSD